MKKRIVADAAGNEAVAERTVTPTTPAPTPTTPDIPQHVDVPEVNPGLQDVIDKGGNIWEHADWDNIVYK